MPWEQISAEDARSFTEAREASMDVALTAPVAVRFGLYARVWAAANEKLEARAVQRRAEGEDAYRVSLALVAPINSSFQAPVPYGLTEFGNSDVIEEQLYAPDSLRLSGPAKPGRFGYRVWQPLETRTSVVDPFLPRADVLVAKAEFISETSGWHYWVVADMEHTTRKCQIQQDGIYEGSTPSLSQKCSAEVALAIGPEIRGWGFGDMIMTPDIARTVHRWEGVSDAAIFLPALFVALAIVALQAWVLRRWSSSGHCSKQELLLCDVFLWPCVAMYCATAFQRMLMAVVFLGRSLLPFQDLLLILVLALISLIPGAVGFRCWRDIHVHSEFRWYHRSALFLASFGGLVFFGAGAFLGPILGFLTCVLPMAALGLRVPNPIAPLWKMFMARPRRPLKQRPEKKIGSLGGLARNPHLPKNRFEIAPSNAHSGSPDRMCSTRREEDPLSGLLDAWNKKLAGSKDMGSDESDTDDVESKASHMESGIKSGAFVSDSSEWLAENGNRTCESPSPASAKLSSTVSESKDVTPLPPGLKFPPPPPSSRPPAGPPVGQSGRIPKGAPRPPPGPPPASQKRPPGTPPLTLKAPFTSSLPSFSLPSESLNDVDPSTPPSDSPKSTKSPPLQPELLKNQSDVEAPPSFRANQFETWLVPEASKMGQEQSGTNASVDRSPDKGNEEDPPSSHQELSRSQNDVEAPPSFRANHVETWLVPEASEMGQELSETLAILEGPMMTKSIPSLVGGSGRNRSRSPIIQSSSNSRNQPLQEGQSESESESESESKQANAKPIGKSKLDNPIQLQKDDSALPLRRLVAGSANPKVKPSGEGIDTNLDEVRAKVHGTSQDASWIPPESKPDPRRLSQTDARAQPEVSTRLAGSVFSLGLVSDQTSENSGAGSRGELNEIKQASLNELNVIGKRNDRTSAALQDVRGVSLGSEIGCASSPEEKNTHDHDSALMKKESDHDSKGNSAEIIGARTAISETGTIAQVIKEKKYDQISVRPGSAHSRRSVVNEAQNVSNVNAVTHGSVTPNSSKNTNVVATDGRMVASEEKRLPLSRSLTALSQYLPAHTPVASAGSVGAHSDWEPPESGVQTPPRRSITPSNSRPGSRSVTPVGSQSSTPFGTPRTPGGTATATGIDEKSVRRSQRLANLTKARANTPPRHAPPTVQTTAVNDLGLSLDQRRGMK